MPTHYDDPYDYNHDDPRDEADLWERSLISAMEHRETMEQKLWSVAPRDTIDYVNCTERDFFYDENAITSLIDAIGDKNIVHVTIERPAKRTSPRFGYGYDYSMFDRGFNAVITHDRGCYSVRL